MEAAAGAASALLVVAGLVVFVLFSVSEVLLLKCFVLSVCLRGASLWSRPWARVVRESVISRAVVILWCLSWWRGCMVAAAVEGEDWSRKRGCKRKRRRTTTGTDCVPCPNNLCSPSVPIQSRSSSWSLSRWIPSSPLPTGHFLRLRFTLLTF
jgi:hypothetical protein